MSRDESKRSVPSVPFIMVRWIEVALFVVLLFGALNVCVCIRKWWIRRTIMRQAHLQTEGVTALEAYDNRHS